MVMVPRRTVSSLARAPGHLFVGGGLRDRSADGGGGEREGNCARDGGQFRLGRVGENMDAPGFGLTAFKYSTALCNAMTTGLQTGKADSGCRKLAASGRLKRPLAAHQEVVAYVALTGGVSSFLQNAHLSRAQNGILINSRLAPILT